MYTYTFLIDDIRLKIALEDIYLIVWYGAMAGMMVIFLYNNETKPLFFYMSLYPFYTAGYSAIIKDTAYFTATYLCFKSSYTVSPYGHIFCILSTCLKLHKSEPWNKRSLEISKHCKAGLLYSYLNYGR